MKISRFLYENLCEIEAIFVNANQVPGTWISFAKENQTFFDTVPLGGIKWFNFTIGFSEKQEKRENLPTTLSKKKSQIFAI